MNNDLKKILNSDTDGLLTYEYIANHMGSCDEDMPVLADNIIRVDMTGQITVSAALYLHATGAEKYGKLLTSSSRLLCRKIENTNILSICCRGFGVKTISRMQRS